MLLETRGISFVKSARLGAGVTHAFLARTGGVSPPPYASLNLSVKGGDTPGNVAENRLRVEDAFGIPEGSITTVRQVHGDRVFIPGDPPPKDSDGCPEADAVVTGKDAAVGVLTADCLPLLLHDPGAGVVAAVHAGWRGSALKVASRAVEVMTTRFGTNPADVLAAIGPHIGPCCYQVGGELPGEFEKAFADAGRFFTRRDGSLYLDLAAPNRASLTEAGLMEENISSAFICTSCRTDLFFSYRKEGATGRQLSFITAR